MAVEPTGARGNGPKGARRAQEKVGGEREQKLLQRMGPGTAISRKDEVLV